jgi:hypothetical protein
LFIRSVGFGCHGLLGPLLLHVSLVSPNRS